MPLMLARPAVLLKSQKSEPSAHWSYHNTGPLPRLIPFTCHSYENTPGVGVFFPFWNWSPTIPSHTVVDFHFSIFCSLFALTSFLATHPKKRFVSLFLATLPKTQHSKSFRCHTCDTPRGAPAGGPCDASVLHDEARRFSIVRVRGLAYSRVTTQ